LGERKLGSHVTPFITSTDPEESWKKSAMSILNTKVDPTTVKYIMYTCMSFPAIAFGLRMYNSAME
jgi:hypothetical protein